MSADINGVAQGMINMAASDVAKDRKRGVKGQTAATLADKAKLVSNLEAAAVRLRDAELAFAKAQDEATKALQASPAAKEIEAARKHYGETLNAFNKFVAPVGK